MISSCLPVTKTRTITRNIRVLLRTGNAADMSTILYFLLQLGSFNFLYISCKCEVTLQFLVWICDVSFYRHVQTDCGSHTLPEKWVQVSKRPESQADHSSQSRNENKYVDR